MAVAVKVEKRELRPRSIRRKLREAGRVPAMVNGHNIENIAISLDGIDLSKAIRENGMNAVYNLDVEGKIIPTLIHSYQRDTFTQSWVHIEFLAVDMAEKQEVEAELVLVGAPVGVKAGGILTQNLYNAMVSATPDKLPERIEVDVTGLEIGDAITISDIPQHSEFDILTDGEEQIAVVEVAAQEEEVVATEETPAE